MLEVVNVLKAFGEQVILNSINLSAAQGEIVCILGASGSGKSTLLRIIAGLETADEGDVRVEGQSITQVPVHERNIGLMFQDFALFPHLNVIDNVRFGLPNRRGEVATRRAEAMLQLVALAGTERRDVASLSGGERQRVALARSLAPQPRLLMLDEPMGSLDAALRDQLLGEVRAILKTANVTALYVTHDQREAFAVADRIVILHNGQVEQAATPRELYRHPATAYTARFLGFENVYDPQSVDVKALLEALGQPTPEAPAVLLHPDALQLAEQNAMGAVEAEVVSTRFEGGTTRLRARYRSLSITLSVREGETTSADNLQVGSKVGVWLREGGLILLQSMDANLL